ncbi:GNAT family N-acetyltransferase [Erysipelothrix aquatica]|uniref:GNAT family N-acetyltransferase n=1 Tax=Erysipelothrix aquatica TaxID=2683714 RepID=UPI0013586506|nr:GNAT family N-acetyltransferase [Erysipelothrix aquatica]
MKNTVLVRPACTEDLAAIHNLSRIELGYDHDFDTLKSTFQMLQTDPNHKVQVAMLENVVVGFLHVNRYDSLLGPAMTNIMAIAVNHNYQGQGIGKILLNAAELWAREQQTFGIRLLSSESRVNAHGFYQHNDYVSHKKQLKFEKIFK